MGSFKNDDEVDLLPVEVKGGLPRGCLISHEEQCHRIHHIIARQLRQNDISFELAFLEDAAAVPSLGEENPLPGSRDSRKKFKSKKKSAKNVPRATSARSSPQNSGNGARQNFNGSEVQGSPTLKSADVSASLDLNTQESSIPSTVSSPPAVHARPLVSQQTQQRLRSQPDWARRLHRLLLLAAQSEDGKPFATDPSPADSHYARLYENVKPVLVPMSLHTVINKLEIGFYATQLEAFNDIYSVWLCAYRGNSPGTPLWMKAYQASRTFLLHLASEPLRDDFTTYVSVSANGGVVRTRSATSEAGRASRGKIGLVRTPGANVDKLLQDFLKDQEQQQFPQSRQTSSAVNQYVPGVTSPAGTHKRAASTTSSGNRRKQPASNRRLTERIRSSNEPVTEQDREEFQACLSKLEIHHHLMLFEAFQRTAVWKPVEKDEVELDVAQTSAPVFRRMLAWCRAQLAQISKRQKQGLKEVMSPAQVLHRTSSAPERVPGSSAATDVSLSRDDNYSTTDPNGEIVATAGSGLRSPDNEIATNDANAGGKISAGSYIKNQAALGPEELQFGFGATSNSDTSSSGESTSESSDDDEDNKME